MVKKTIRTPETEQRYMEEMAKRPPGDGCVLCSLFPVHTYKLWKIVPNDFPYDKIAARHDMVIPLRHTSEINEEERLELEEIKKTFINDNYRYILEATHRTKSIPSHYHLHLIELK